MIGQPGRHLASGTPLRWIGVIFLRAIPAGVAALTLHGTFGLVHWYTWNAYAVIGSSISLFGLGGELLWRSFVNQTAMRARSAAGLLSRFAIWFLSGGCGYTTGMLAAKKLLLLGFYDIPVRPIFLVGGILGCVLQAVIELTKLSNILGGAYDPR